MTSTKCKIIYGQSLSRGEQHPSISDYAWTRDQYITYQIESQEPNEGSFMALARGLRGSMGTTWEGVCLSLPTCRSLPELCKRAVGEGLDNAFPEGDLQKPSISN